MEKSFSQSVSSGGNNSSNNNTIYSTSIMKKYWCHLCKKEFRKLYIENIDVQCSYCGNTFCEELLENIDINNESHPCHFVPYSASNNNRNNNSSNQRSTNIIEQIINQRNTNRPRNSTELLDFILETILLYNYNDNIESIINHIMMNDTNKYGNPPASKKEVEKLETCKIDKEILNKMGIENSCAVCKDEFAIGDDCLLMPCKHHFHKDCLFPWLKERNSCPVCRFELPTDDEDFEQRKKSRLNNNNNSGLNNNTNNGNQINVNELNIRTHS